MYFFQTILINEEIVALCLKYYEFLRKLRISRWTNQFWNKLTIQIKISDELCGPWMITRFIYALNIKELQGWSL